MAHSIYAIYANIFGDSILLLILDSGITLPDRTYLFKEAVVVVVGILVFNVEFIFKTTSKILLALTKLSV
jgi:hypothetical protein